MPGLNRDTTLVTNERGKKIVICGGGLVGCLAACYFGERGFDVSLYENRGDIRQMKVVVGRSINMAMSVRGREALRLIGAEHSICSKGIEMYSRMLHDTKGNTRTDPYGTDPSQCILSIDRRFLNELLLTETEKYPNVKVNFNHKLIKCDTNTGSLIFEKRTVSDEGKISKETMEVKSDLIFGCDGAYSAVRASLLKDKPMDFSQSYISSYYVELHIAATPSGTFALPPKHLHIWPRGDFMLIALPNQDCSFTCTLFMPLHMFEAIKTPDQLTRFFRTYFVDALELIGSEDLINVFFTSKPSPLVSIKMAPHHGTKCVLVGDAAHAMVPFYGQGMNCGFEDCIEFFELLDKHGMDNLEKLLSSYSAKRVPDSHAICDLAIENYEEMRYLVTTRKYKLRKRLDNFMHWLLPKTWIPRYTMVTFSRIRYSDIVKMREKQDKLIGMTLNFAAVSLLALGAGLAIRRFANLTN